MPGKHRKLKKKNFRFVNFIYDIRYKFESFKHNCTIHISILWRFFLKWISFWCLWYLRQLYGIQVNVLMQIWYEVDEKSLRSSFRVLEYCLRKSCFLVKGSLKKALIGRINLVYVEKRVKDINSIPCTVRMIIESIYGLKSNKVTSLFLSSFETSWELYKE